MKSKPAPVRPMPISGTQDARVNMGTGTDNRVLAGATFVIVHGHTHAARTGLYSDCLGADGLVEDL